MKTGRAWPGCLGLALVVALLSACASAETGGITITDAYVQVVGAAPAGSSDHTDHVVGTNGAGYLIIRNSGRAADRLLGVNCEAAQAVEMHATEMHDNVMTMKPLSVVEIPAGGEVAFKPGGYHLMLIGLTRPLALGERVTLTFTFEHAGEIAAEAEVRAP